MRAGRALNTRTTRSTLMRLMTCSAVQSVLSESGPQLKLGSAAIKMICR